MHDVPARISWKVKRAGRGMYTGTITISFGDDGELPMSVAGDGFNPRQALARAAIGAKSIATNPELMAVLPPGTAAAIMAVENLAKARDIGATLARYGGRGAHRLARALGFRR